MYGKILVPVDGSGTAALGLAEAIRLAKSQGSTLRLLHVINDFPALASPEAALYSDELLKRFQARGQAILAEAQAVARRHGLEAETKSLEVTGGPAGEAIVGEAPCSQWLNLFSDSVVL